MTRLRILTIDGGGIRGIIPALWLMELERQLGQPLHKYIDIVAGTSTGAIIAAAIACGMPVRDCLALYKLHGARIFPPERFGQRPKGLWDALLKLGSLGQPAYEPDALVEVLRDAFRTNRLKDIQPDVDLIIPAFDVDSRAVFLMSSYDQDRNEISLCDAILASSAAPTYFPAHTAPEAGNRPLVDGGVFANNPSVLALSEAIKRTNNSSLSETERDHDLRLLSFGTGSMKRRISVKDAKSWGPAQWALPMINVMFDANSELSDICAQQIVRDQNYVRMQVNLDPGVNDDMDDADPTNLGALERLAQDHMERQGRRDFERAKMLLQLEEGE